MQRTIYKSLLNWKKDPSKKPLLLQGARQVGKTYVVNQFGENEYGDFVYLNFEQDINLHSFFKGQLFPEKIMDDLSLYLGKKISAKNTLIFLDEIQVLPEVLTSLKYFYEQAPDFDVIAAGSLLGVSIAAHTSFPVGKVNFLSMYPLSFIEYLHAMGDELLAEEISTKSDTEPINEALHQKLTEHVKKYLFLGGMPEVVQNFIVNRDIVNVRKIQNEILKAYDRDFSKYNTKGQSLKTAELWNSLPSQLSRENKKFKYNSVRKKARASNYEQTVDWLKNGGLVNLTYNISTPKVPLSGYANHSKFKLYLVDVGLLGAMLNISSSIIADPSKLYTEYNGAFIENFIAQELVVYRQETLYYWTSRSDAEVDFIVQIADHIYPIEVKSGLSRNLKSLRSYDEKYKPKLVYRASPRNFSKSDNFINIPLYGMMYFSQKG